MEVESEFEECDDDDEEERYDPRSPLPDSCENEILGIESFYSCFISRYNACPAFFTGSLCDACQTTLNSTNIEEARPLLIYIHHDMDLFTNIFCSNIFCSEVITDYLLCNYVVWPWDITFPSNADILRQKWLELFPIESAEAIVTAKHSMLIGIMRRSKAESSWMYPSDYEFEVLFRDGQIVRTEENATRETVLRELIVFKEKYEENEKDLAFNFIDKTRLNKDIFLEIIKYLSLNDIVRAFSDRILPVLADYHTSFSLLNPSEKLINMILRTFQSEEIVSLGLSTYNLWTIEPSDWLTRLTGVTSLSVFNLHQLAFPLQYTRYFSNLTRLSLSYDDDMNFGTIRTAVQFLLPTIQRFEIHCNGAICPPYSQYSLELRYTPNLTVRYFLIDIGYVPVPSLNQCSQNHQSCFLKNTIDLIRTLVNIRQVRFLTSRDNLELLVNADEWRTVFVDCSRLNKIRMDIREGSSERDLLLERAMVLQNSLQNDQPTIRVQFVCL